MGPNESINQRSDELPGQICTVPKIADKVKVFTCDVLPRRYFRKITRVEAGINDLDGSVQVTRSHAWFDFHGVPLFSPYSSLMEFSPDIIYAQEYYHPCSMLGFLAAKRLKVPFVFAQHMYRAPEGVWGAGWGGITR